MRKTNLFVAAMAMTSAILLSIPWLVPHCGLLSLIAFLPLLFAEDIALQLGVRRFWWYYFGSFVLWNALTTFWVCNATVAGGIFAILANAFQMSLIFALFHYSRKRLPGVLPYLLLAAAWIAWERLYFSVELSWPWLVLGNAFASSTKLVQWYEWTGSLGGSLWVWACNLTLYGFLVAFLSDGWHRWTNAAKVSSLLALSFLLIGAPLISNSLYKRAEESTGEVEVLIGQPNLDPYHKFESMTQKEQNELLLSLLRDSLNPDDSLLIIAPETFTPDVLLNNIAASPTVISFNEFLDQYKGCEMLFGASASSIHDTRTAPSPCARPYGDGWMESHNVALLTDGGKDIEHYIKSRLVVGVEKTPYPKLFIPAEKLVCRIIGMNPPLMGRCVGQPSPTVLHYRDSIALGCTICYESVYGEFCTDYVREGARFMTEITNDAWWGDTPGYRQHCDYARLRAIELRRDFARCGNTGISCTIDCKGDILEAGPWWEPYVLRGKVSLHDRETLFVRYGDVCGRVCTLVFLLLALVMCVRIVKRS